MKKIKNTKALKQTFYTLLLFFSAEWLGAQTPSDNIMQPGHFVGRRISDSGEITKVYEAEFSYMLDGKLSDFNFPEFSLSSHHTYDGDYLIKALTHHNGGHPQFDEVLNYNYENGRIKSIFHGWDAMNPNECWIYSYDENGRLSRKDYGGNSSNIINYFIYEYENGGRTKIETSYIQTLQGWQSVWVAEKATTYRYSEDYKLISVQTDKYNYNGGGEIIESVKKNYSYTPSGQMEEEITQMFFEDMWINESIMRYVYDDNDRVSEQINGIWSAEHDDWEITRKVEFEFSEDGSVYSVSFLKKSGENWVWDVFNNQTLFFNNVSKTQQRELSYFVYEEMNETANINQFVFDLVPTNRPVYLSVKEKQFACCLYPNPGENHVTIKAPIENAVIRFYDMQGRMLFAEPFDFSTIVNTNGWIPGMYLWEIWNGTQMEVSGKWIKK